MTKHKPFDFLAAINSTKEDLLADPESDPNDYIPFVTNRSLSYFMDTILYANEMNLYPELARDMQFRYFLNSIRPRKRFAKWVKPLESDDIKLVQDAFGYNAQHAAQTLKLLTADELDMLRKQKEVGGSDTRVSRDVC
jgi:hypothetical protein